MKTERLILGPLGTNCYIVYDELSKEAALFDPACNSQKIISKISELELQLKYIIITHAHCDHIEALDDIKEQYNAGICISSCDASALNDTYLSLCSHFEKNAPKSKADIIIKDNDVLFLGEEKLSFILTPGHTKGGMCICFDGGLISGDTLFLESVGRTDFPGGSSAELIHSIKDKLFSLPNDTVVYPGHGDITSIGHEKDNNPFVW